MEPLAGAEIVTFNQRWPTGLLLWLSVLSCSFSSPASLPPSLAPRVRSSYTLGRTFLGLDKCNACIGTSICKKFFKEEIRSESLPINSEEQIELLLV
ncbi:deleted in autism-related protein 1 [Sigmodon hispidus]